MKWQGRKRSSNVEDRRGRSGSSGGGFSPLMAGLIMRFLFSKTGLVVAGIAVLFLWITGTNPLTPLQQFTGGGMGNAAVSQYEGSPEEEALAEFSAVVLQDTEDVWNQLLENYREPVLVLFISVRLELQADFLSGVWAHHAQRTKQILDEGDIEEALQAASAIGDDMIQKQVQGRVVPDSFTHGTSEQRMRWFKNGFTTGDLTQGDTFNAEVL